VDIISLQKYEKYSDGHILNRFFIDKKPFKHKIDVKPFWGIHSLWHNKITKHLRIIGEI
jgi:hypothetical protein